MTETFVDITDIKNGVIILKNKALRAILNISSINFALKSEEEQKALIFAFQNFLNSLDFPVQIIAQSRRLDIKPYLEDLSEKRDKQDNELLSIQTTEYIEFIKGLIEMANIMKKSFYVIVPFSYIEAKRESGFDKFKNIIKPAPKVKFTQAAFDRYREQLWQRIEHVVSGLSGMGLTVEALNSKQILELFYGLYNPE